MIAKAVLFATRLNPNCTDTELLAMLPSARQVCMGLGVSGALLFDGEQVLQLMHGTSEAVEHAMQRWMQHGLHQDLVILVQACASCASAKAPWQAGYADAGVLDQVREVAARGGDAVAAFVGVLKRCDVA